MRASLFVTCLADVFFADGAADAVRLLRSLGVEVDFPVGQTCCGQPAFNAGDHASATRLARRTAEVLAGSEEVVVLSGSCAAMLRCFAPELLEGGVRPSPRVWDLSELVVRELGVRELGNGLRGVRVAYHHGCHALRELGVRDEPLALLEGCGATVVPWEAAEECCGFGGLFSAKLPEVSVAMADRKLDTLPTVDVLTSADGGCLLQLRGRLRKRGLDVPVLPLPSLLWRGRSQGATRGGGAEKLAAAGRGRGERGGE